MGTREGQRGSGRGGIAILLCALFACAPAAASPIVGATQTVVRQVFGALGPEMRTLIVDSDVFLDEDIKTGENSATRIIFKDTTNLTLGENSVLRLTRLVFDPDPSRSRVAVKAAQGVFRWTSGNLPSGNYGIATPVATIGVRGTTLEFLVAPDGTTTVAVSRGAVVVSNLHNESVTLQAGEATTVLPPESDGSQAPPSPPGDPPAGFLDAVRKMTITIRVADAPGEVSPAAGGSGLIVPTSTTDSDGTGGTGGGPTGGTGRGPFGANGPPGQHNPTVLQSLGPNVPTGDPSVTPTPPPPTIKVPPQGKPVRSGGQVKLEITGGPVTAEVGPLSGALNGPGTPVGGVKIGPGGSLVVTFDVGPQHGPISAQIPFSLTEPGAASVSGVVNFDGVAVGPVIGAQIVDPTTKQKSQLFTGFAADNQLDLKFGAVAQNQTRSFVLNIGNLTTELGLDADLTGLTLLGFSISKFTDHFSVEAMRKDGTLVALSDGELAPGEEVALGDLLMPGEFLQLLLVYSALSDPGTYDGAFLTIFTDENAPFCADPKNPLECQRGTPIRISMSGTTLGDAIEVPEPGSLALLLPALLVGFGLRRRR